MIKTIILILTLVMNLTQGQIITGCLRYFRNPYNQQRCIQCIFGMGLTQNNTCQFCRFGFAVTNGVCRKVVSNNNTNNTNTNKPVVNNNIQQPRQKPQNIKKPQQIQQKIPTTSQSYQPNVNSPPNNISISNSSTDSSSFNLDIKTNSFSWSGNWGNTQNHSFESFPVINNSSKSQSIPKQQSQINDFVVNIPINQLGLVSNSTSSQKIIEIPSVISTKVSAVSIQSPNFSIPPPPIQTSTPTPTLTPKAQPQPQPQPQPQNSQSQQQKVQQNKKIIHKFPQFPFCFDYVDGNCWACVPGYVLNLVLNKCVAHVPAPNIAFKQNAQQKPKSSTPEENCNLYSQQKNICQQCFRNYYFNIQKKQCLVVNPLCRTYNKSNGRCQTCYNTYKLNDGNCIKS